MKTNALMNEELWDFVDFKQVQRTLIISMVFYLF